MCTIVSILMYTYVNLHTCTHTHTHVYIYIYIYIIYIPCICAYIYRVMHDRHNCKPKNNCGTPESFTSFSNTNVISLTPFGAFCAKLWDFTGSYSLIYSAVRHFLLYYLLLITCIRRSTLL